MIKGKTKSGIKFQLDERIKDDARFLYYLTRAQDENVSLEDKGAAVMGVMKLIFGTDEGVIQFMNTVAAVNGGVCGVEQMLAEVGEMFEALNVKN